jgi:hypothetical protein
MKFRERLDKAHNKTTTTAIVNEIYSQPKKMDELMQIFIDGPLKIRQRAAWPLGLIAQKEPELLTNYYPLLINQLHQKETHQAVTRNILRAFQYVIVPEKHQGKLLNRCFEFLTDSSQPIAVKAFSMTVIYNLSKEYPDIVPELKVSIENLLPNGSAGIKSRGNKILREINRI